MQTLTGMRTLILAAVMSLTINAELTGQRAATPGATTPRSISLGELASPDLLIGQLVSVSAKVRETDTPQLFTIGAQPRHGVHVLIPRPATDAATIGDSVSVTGLIRRFSSDDFERDYSWFRRLDYPDLKNSDYVIVAVSVRTPEGTELVPPGVISETTVRGKSP